MGSDSSEGLELRSTHFCQENKRSYTPKPFGPTDKKIPSKTIKHLKNLILRSSSIVTIFSRKKNNIVPLQSTTLQTLSGTRKDLKVLKFQKKTLIPNIILDNTKLLSSKSIEENLNFH